MVLSFLFLAACSKVDSKTKGNVVPAVPVIAAAVSVKTVPLLLTSVGTVQPYVSVAVKTRIDGLLDTVKFKEGETVRQGQVLFSLDPRALQAQVAQAEATLAKDRATYDNAVAQDKRYLSLLVRKFISQEFYAQVHTNLGTARATVDADRAALRNAQVQLDYATITSPIDGVAGKVLIQRGNMIKANDTNSLVVINQVQPIYVEFSVPEQNLSAIRQAMAQGDVPVEAVPDAGKRAQGTLNFVDNSVDATTGTIRLRATFANQDRALWPGQYVTATATLGEELNALTVPAQAVQPGPEGPFVYVVKPDATAEVRKVAAGRSADGFTVISKGLAAGEKVVVDGQSRLAPGAKVKLQNKPQGGAP